MMMSKSKAMQDELIKTSYEERQNAKWRLRNYDNICSSILIYEERGQGYSDGMDMRTYFQGEDDAVRAARNIKEKQFLEMCRDLYVEESCQHDVWDIAIGHKKMSDYPPWEQAIFQKQLIYLYNGVCIESGNDTTRIIRDFGNFESRNQLDDFLLVLSQCDIPQRWRDGIYSIAVGGSTYDDYDTDDKAELEKIYKDILMRMKNNIQKK